MKSKAVSLTLLLSLSFMLMLTASYLSNVQNWLVLNEISSQSYENKGVIPVGFIGGISAMSSGMSQERAVVEQSDLEPFLERTQLLPQEDDSFSTVEVVSPYRSSRINHVSEHSIKRMGGGENSRMPAPTFIEYSDALVLEVPKALATPTNLKRMVSRILLSPSRINSEDLLSTAPIQARYKPWFYKQVVNQAGQSIRYSAGALAYADYLLQHHSQEIKDEVGEFVLIQIPRVEHQLLSHIERYKSWVDEYSRQFKVPKDLVFAIIEVESAFNPRAVSKSNALGLMQIKAGAAGRDVYQYVEGRAGQPTPEELFDAQTNLRVGIAYMGLLKHDYLQGVRNPDIKEMLSISSYNAGISRTLKLFADSPEEAILRVNQLHPKRVYRTLRYEHASSEARQYLDKVLKAKKRYSETFARIG